MGVDLALQGVEAGFKHQPLLLFERHLDAERVPDLERDANHDRRAEPDQRLQPEIAGKQREEAMRKHMRNPVANHLHRHDEDKEENLAVDARFSQVAAHPAVKAQIDEGREGPDLFLFDEAADHARGQAKRDIERKREKFVVQDGRNGQHAARKHGPAGPDEQAEKNDGFKGDVGGKKVGHHEPDPYAERKRHQKKRQQRERLGGAALLRKEKPAEACGPRQNAGHRGNHAQLDQQRDKKEFIRHPINVSRRAGGRRESSYQELDADQDRFLGTLLQERRLDGMAGSHALESHPVVERKRIAHHRHGIADDLGVARGAGFIHDPFEQRAAQAEAAKCGADVKVAWPRHGAHLRGAERCNRLAARRPTPKRGGHRAAHRLRANPPARRRNSGNRA